MLPLTLTGSLNVTPPSSECEARMLLPFFVDDDVPVARSQTT
jgi:hypothetical protein